MILVPFLHGIGVSTELLYSSASYDVPLISMISSRQVWVFIVVIASTSALELEKIADGVDNIFLKSNVTAEESRLILSDARQSYQTLTYYNKETDPDRKKILLNKVKTFTTHIIDDLQRTGITLQQFFRNVNSYLKGDGNVSLEAEEPLTTTIPMVLEVLERKIATQPVKNHYDVKDILSLKDNDVDIFRKNDNINPTTVGYFFLEAFATIFGLSWGILSMILSDFQ